jgi:hypothetical protein
MYIVYDTVRRLTAFSHDFATLLSNLRFRHQASVDPATRATRAYRAILLLAAQGLTVFTYFFLLYTLFVMDLA